MTDPPKAVTHLLRQLRNGQREALDELMPLVYDQLRTLAEKRMRSESPDHTLRPTAIVNEAYLRLIGAEISFEDRAHFFAVAARLMRRILTDHARARCRDKRGGGARKLSLEEVVVVTPESPEVLMELHEALEQLAGFDPRKTEIIELSYFGGLSNPEVAAVLGISERTVLRELRLGRAWLYNQLRPGHNQAV